MLLKKALKTNLTHAIAGGSGALAGAVLLEALLDDFGDVVKQKYISTHKPVWETSGQSSLLTDYGNLYRGTRTKETLYNILFGAPESFVNKGLTSEWAKKVKLPKDQLGAKAIVSRLASTPEVKAMGKANAEELISQLKGIAPKTMAVAPSVAIPVLQSAIDTGTLSIRPEIAEKLAKAEEYMNR